jgi:hypothetical protein
MINESVRRRNLQVTQDARDRIHDVLAGARGGRKFVPTREAARRFFEKFSASNEEIRRMWFPERQSLFDPDFLEYSESELPQDNTPAHDTLVDLLIKLSNGAR